MIRKYILLIALCLTLSVMADEVRSLVPRGTDVYRHGYMELNATDRALYDTILGSIIGFEANNYSAFYYHKCPLMGVDNMRNSQLVAKDMMRMYNDIPELYILASTVAMYDYSNYYYYARIGYQNTPASYLNDLKALRAAYDSCSQGLTAGMSEYEQIKLLHDNYCRYYTYGDMTGAQAGTAKGALINRRAVCQGIAYGWLYLCQQAGLKCIYVSGQLGSTNHSWNYIQVDGKWYLIDLTTDGGLVGVDVGYSAFLKGKTYLKDHYSLLNSDGNDPNCNGVYQSLPELADSDYVPQGATAIEPIASSPYVHGIKIMQNGQLLIQRDGKVYIATGQEL